MSAPRNDDFSAIEEFRIKPEPVRKALREWRGNVRFAVDSEESADAVANCLQVALNDSASWTGGSVEYTDNVVTVYGAIYRARSANAYDAETLARKCCGEAGAQVLSPVAVQTLESLKLSPGR